MRDLPNPTVFSPENASVTFPPASAPEPGGVVTIIRPSMGWAPLKIRDLWAYRELLYFLVWRDIKVRYRQTVIGAAWVIIQPLMTAAVFAVFFGHLAGIQSDGIPYPLFSLAALVPWTFFARGLALSSNSLVANTHLITKIYFPRLLIPLARILGGLPDFALSFLVLLAVAWSYGLWPRLAATILVPLLCLLTLCVALGAGLWLSALNSKYRDVDHAVPFLTQLWLFATPIAYPSSLIHEPWRTLYGINPMVGVVEGFRWALVGRSEPPMAIMLISAIVAFTMATTGALYFRRVEKTFADIL